MVMIHETCRLYPYTIGLCHPAYRPFLALAMTCRAARVLEGGINMRNRSSRCYLRRVSMDCWFFGAASYGGLRSHPSCSALAESHRSGLQSASPILAQGPP